MKNLRMVSVILVALVALFFLVSALLPSKYQVTKEVQISASPERIYGLVANVKEWSSWYPIYRVEPLAEYLYVGEIQEVGSLMSWRGLDIGEGQVALTKTNPPFAIEMKKSVTAPKVDESSYLWNFKESAAGSVHVTWSQVGDLDYPLGRWRGLFMGSVLGPTLEQGLMQLKTVAELRPLEPPAKPLDPFPNSPDSEEN